MPGCPCPILGFDAPAGLVFCGRFGVAVRSSTLGFRRGASDSTEPSFFADEKEMGWLLYGERRPSVSMCPMETDELAAHLDALQREECYQVDAVLKESAYETTQRVFFIGANGAKQGPYIRKYIKRDTGMGTAYRRLFDAQRLGKRPLFIPVLHDCYDMDDTLVVVMEFVRGETLQDVVYRCNPSLALAADVFPRLCDAVIELHEGFDAPIIHRDLKPTNVILSRDSLTVIDFGIARAYNEASDIDTTHFGTRAYAPPEQFGYGQTTVRSDVYALGMLLYFCLVEKTPDTHVREKGFFDARIPGSVREVLLRATAFDPADRYENVRSLKRDFLAAMRREYGSNALDAESHDSVPPRDLNMMDAVSDGTRSLAANRAFPPPQSAPVPLPAPRSVSSPVFVSASAFASAPKPADAAGAVRFSSSASTASSLVRGVRSLRVPPWMGLVWDAFVVLFLVMVGFIGFDPNRPVDEFKGYPREFVFFVNVCIMLMLAVAAYPLFDKRLVASRLPVVMRVSKVREIVVCVVVVTSIFVFVVFVGVILNVACGIGSSA